MNLNDFEKRLNGLLDCDENHGYHEVYFGNLEYFLSEVDLITVCDTNEDYSGILHFFSGKLLVAQSCFQSHHHERDCLIIVFSTDQCKSLRDNLLVTFKKLRDSLVTIKVTNGAVTLDLSLNGLSTLANGGSVPLPAFDGFPDDFQPSDRGITEFPLHITKSSHEIECLVIRSSYNLQVSGQSPF
ncbi:MAG: hypothetical protein ACFFD4_30695 [Candidatus Odinarchaeota archaeon]